ncbi:MAG: hypothetical protein Q4G58_09170 [bacterium]|nr:hypothetical protein [bacterium]
MHYTIVSCSPQNKARSSSSCIAAWVQEVLENADIYYINDRKKWKICADAILQSENVIFVIPLYVEGVPGIMLEFLETLDPEKKKAGTMSFILQGGFEEASQLRTAEKYLKTLPSYFHCEYGGTLLKGGMFGMASMRGKKFKEEMKKCYMAAMEEYKKKNYFDEKTVKEFAGPEYYSAGMIRLAKLVTPLNRLVWFFMGKRMGATTSLKSRPYKCN